MTRNELYELLKKCGWETTPIHTLDKIWGRPFDGVTEEINTAKSDSSTSLIPQTNPAPFVSEADARVAEFKGEMSAISQAFDEHPSGKDEECDEQDHRRL
jgi:hypothetical protein